MHTSMRSAGLPRFLTFMVSIVVSLATVLLVSGTGTSTAAPPDVQGNKTTANVHGKGPNGEVFNGQYQITSFQQGGPTGVEAVGNLTGKLTGQGPAQSVTQNDVAMPVNLAQTTASCQILDLVLGPLNLDLLGLQVSLDTVHLNVTAVPGAGNLLGNLLCSVAGLLDGTNLGGLTDILNQILQALLGGLG